MQRYKAAYDTCKIENIEMFFMGNQVYILQKSILTREDGKKMDVGNSGIIPQNLKYYDVFGELSKFGVIEWRQRLKDVSVGDIVYIYLSKPESYIAFKCIVEKVNVRRLSRTIDDSACFKTIL